MDIEKRSECPQNTVENIEIIRNKDNKMLIKTIKQDHFTLGFHCYFITTRHFIIKTQTIT